MKSTTLRQHFFCAVFLSSPFTLDAQSAGIPDQVAGAHCFLFSSHAGSMAFGNPAAPDTSAAWALGVFSASSFLVKELNEYGVAFSKRFWKSNFVGGGYRYKGYALYKTSQGSLSFCRFFGKSFSAGARVERFSVAQGEGYGVRQYWNLRAGTTVRLNNRIAASSAFDVPITRRLDPNTAPFHMGLMCRFSEVFIGITECSMNSSNAEIRWSIRYVPDPKLEFVGGIGGKPLVTSFGVKMICKSMRIFVSAGYRPVLGFSPATGIDYFFNP